MSSGVTYVWFTIAIMAVLVVQYLQLGDLVGACYM